MTLFKTFYSIEEDHITQKWLTYFNLAKEDYQRWYNSQPLISRPSLTEASAELKKHMPEFFSLWEKIIKLTNADEDLATMLTMYCPPPYQRGCAHAVWTKDTTILVKNYDYTPSLLEGRILKSHWLDKSVIAVTDSLWGALDGINDTGLSLSLVYGGNNVTGKGFAIPLVLNYLLNTCSTTTEVIEKLQKIPVNMSYNITSVDIYQHVATIELSPLTAPTISARPFAVNKQGDFDLSEYTIFSNAIERERVLAENLYNPIININAFIEAFQYAPLFNTNYTENFGTLYTAIYNPLLKATEFRWPGYSPLYQSFEYFTEQQTTIYYR